MKCNWKSYQACQTCLDHVCEKGMKDEERIREEVARVEHEIEMTKLVSVPPEYSRALSIRWQALKWVLGETDV